MTKKSGALHEDLAREHEVVGGSNRSFGLVFFVFFTIVGGLPVLSGQAPRPVAFAIGAVFLVLAFVAPRALAPLNRLWTKFGLLLQKLVSPIVMGIVFFFVVTPMAIVMRAMGKDLLRLKWDKNAKTYWIDRNPPGPKPESMSRQF